MSGGPSQERSKNEKVERPRGVIERRPTLPRTLQARQSNTGASSGSEPRPVEHGGPSGLEPTRYGDWERAGRCIDF